jgi:hypothetical protein
LILNLLPIITSPAVTDPVVPAVADPVVPAVADPIVPAAADPLVPLVTDPVVSAVVDPVVPITEEIENPAVVVHLDHSYGTNGEPTTVEVDEDQPRQKKARVGENLMLLMLPNTKSRAGRPRGTRKLDHQKNAPMTVTSLFAARNFSCEKTSMQIIILEYAIRGV